MSEMPVPTEGQYTWTICDACYMEVDALDNTPFIIICPKHAAVDRLVEALRKAERAMHAYLTNPGVGDEHDRAIGLAKAARQGASVLLAEIEAQS